MKNRLRVYPFLFAVSFVLLSLVLSALVFYIYPMEWTLENFNKKKTSLRYEGFVLASIFWALIVLILYKVNWYRALFFFIFLNFSALTLVSSWLNFDFYKDFLTLDAFFMTSDMVNSEGSQGLSSLASYEMAVKVMTVSVCLSLCVLVLRYFAGVLSIGYLLVTLLLSGAIFGNYYDRYVQIDVADRALFYPPLDVHPITYFLFSGEYSVEMTDELKGAAKYIYPESDQNDYYPLLRTQSKPSPLYDGPNLNGKNVIFFVMESVRDAETGYTGGGVESITPNLDKILNSGLRFDNFYANSHQTIRGEISILCSIFDFSRGSPISNRLMDLRARCLPEILKEKGYGTHWYHGNEKTFFNRGDFLPTLGFDRIIDQYYVEEHFPDAEQKGWGIADVDMMRIAFEDLSQQQQPFLAQIVTLTNHFPFDWGFEPVDAESSENDQVYNHFLRGVNYTDKSLGVFWDLLQRSELKENTILVVLSDHGLWMASAEDDDQDLALMHRNQFKLPMAIWHHEIEAESYSRLASQIDIAPTILDMLGLEYGEHAFIGESIYKEDRRDLVLATGFNNLVSVDKEHFCFPNVGREIKNGYYRDQEGSKAITNKNLICVANDGSSLSEEEVGEQLDDKLSLYRKILRLNDYGLFEGFLAR